MNNTYEVCAREPRIRQVAIFDIIIIIARVQRKGLAYYNITGAVRRNRR